MKLKNEKKVMNIFVEKDNDLRPLLMKPFHNTKDNGRVWASDGHKLLIVDPSLLRCKYGEGSLGTTIPVDKKNCDETVSVEAMREAYMKIPLEDEYVIEEGEEIECEECDGEGEVEWEYTDSNGHTYYEVHDCPVCDGTGECNEQKKVKTGRKIPARFSIIDFGGATFSARIINDICDALDLLGIKEIHHVVKSPNQMNLFEVMDGVQIIIMPALGAVDSPVSQLRI